MGIHKLIPTPEAMWELFLKYKKWAKDNPFRQHDFVGGQGQSVHRNKERPLTFEGFTNYLWDNDIMTDPKDYFSNREGRYEAFVPIATRIKEVIRQDQIEGGMAGLYNPSITQRLNNLVEKSETKVSMEQPLFPDVNE